MATTLHSADVGRRISMRTPFLVPVMMGRLALGATHALAQSGRERRDERRDQRNQSPNEYDRRSNAPRWAKAVVVPANVAWTNTGIQVTRGQWMRFEPSGEIRLSFNGDDMAKAAGSDRFRFAEKAPIPTIPVGALIGRVNSGKPFSIGNTTQA